MIQTIVTLAFIGLLGGIWAYFGERKVKIQDEYEKEFERRTRGQFVDRFETNPYDFRNHYD